MVKIEVNNHKCKIYTSAKNLLLIQKAFKVRHPNAYFVRMHTDRRWDGMIDYVTESGYFKTGLLPQVVEYINTELMVDVEYIDNRADFDHKPKVPEKIGEHFVRPYQKSAIRAIINNHIGELHFPIGVIDAATNAGKTTIAAGIYLSYQKKIPMLVLINDGDLYEQFKNEIPKLVGDNVGFVRGKENNWDTVTVAMVQTLSRNIHKHKRELTKFGIVIVDEADLANNKTYKKVIENCYNANIRCGMSGSIYLSKLKKDFTHNQNLKGYFGEKVFTITNKDLVEKGYSTEMVIRIFPGNTKIGTKGMWEKEYESGITYNEERAMLCVDRLKHNLKIGRKPALVVCQYHKHIDIMYMVINRELGKKYRIAYVHGGFKTSERNKIFQDFREGKIDILISSFIVRRGKNFPKLKYLLNAAAGDSHATVLQLMGRLFRKDKGKKKVYMEDFYDKGIYLERHSKHRVIYYKKEGFKVVEKYKQ